jgi:hypothetical protein
MPAPSLDLLFTNRSLVDNISGQNLITFTRASSATYVDRNGIIRTAAVNEPRFDHNPATGESLGLLVEEQRTNLVLRSETFGTTWALFRASIVTDSTASPDGAATADTMVEDTTVTSSHGTVQQINLTAAVYTFTIFLKAAGRNWVNINPTDSTDHRTWFDFSNGVVGTNAAGNTSSIKAYPNGWYRCTITRTMDQVSCGLQISLTTGNNVTTYSGDGTSGAYIWGAQVEAGAFPTSYIPTTTAAVTRAADLASITGANFSSWFNNTEGTLFCDFRLDADRSATRWAAQIGPTALTGPNSNIIGKVGTDLLYAETRNNSLTQYSVSRTILSSRRAKIAYAIKNLDHQAAFDGVLSVAGTGTLGTPSNTVLLLGRNVGSAEMLCGTIARLTYWPARLPNPILQTLTQ